MENFITILELEQMIENNQNIQLIDVRSNAEYDELHIPIAINIPLEKIDDLKDQLNKNQLIITTCGKGGGRSEQAAQKLKELGFISMYLEGGTLAWFDR